MTIFAIDEWWLDYHPLSRLYSIDYFFLGDKTRYQLTKNKAVKYSIKNFLDRSGAYRVG